MIISDVESDAIYRNHHTPALYGFRSYISMPIVLLDGRFFGTLCAIDPQPRDLDDADTIDMFRMFARIVGSQLDQADRLAAAEQHISVQAKDAELREQFIAVLGHDLRNPVANIKAGVTLLATDRGRERADGVLLNMRKSADRMSSMIDNILDFARGRLGGGLSLRRAPTKIAPLIAQIVSEVRHGNPDRAMTADCDVDAIVDCDPTRIEPLLSNLVGNAMTHGAADQPVEISCHIDDGDLLLSVSNGGEPIPETARALLFHPFARGKVSPDAEGLGLGLFIASEIASAHGGRLSVSSDEQATCFTLRIPLDAGSAESSVNEERSSTPG